MISDWSGISFEYAFTFERPVIFIDVPKKILNPNSDDISLEPIEISIRNKIGHVVSPKDLEKIPSLISSIYDDDKNKEDIIKIRTDSSAIGAEYIQKLKEKIKLKK